MTPDAAAGAGPGAVVDRVLRAASGAATVALPVLLVLGPLPTDIAVSAAAILFILRCLVVGDWRWLEEPWVLVALALWAYLVINASYVAADQEPAIGRASAFGRHVVFAAALQFWLLTDGRIRRLLLLVLALTLAFVIADCLLQYLTGRDLFGHAPANRFRLTGPFGDPRPGTFISYLCMPVVAVGWAWAAGRRDRIVAALAASALTAMVLVMIGERTALLMYLVGLGMVALLLPPARRPLIATGLIAVLVLVAVLATQPALQRRFVVHTQADLTDFWDRRVGELLLRGQEVWWDNPLFGVGPRNFRNICERDDFLPEGPVETRCYTHPHHIWNEWLAETGLVGFAGFLALLVLWGRTIGLRLWRSGVHRALLSGLAIALVLALWPIRPSMSFFSTWPATIFWLLIGWSLAVAAPRGRPPPRADDERLSPPS